MKGAAMKKSYLFLGLALAVMLSAGQVFADAIITDLDISKDGPTNINSKYWSGEDQNVFKNGQLNNSSEKTEEAWLEALLGKVYDSKDIFTITRIEAGTGGLGADVKSLTDFNPGFHWDYAVVKYGNFWMAYEDTKSDHLLSTEFLGKGISHITFFDPPTTNVPEPAIIGLLGFGLAGLVTVARKSRHQ
jgi:hypothetical protein